MARRRHSMMAPVVPSHDEMLRYQSDSMAREAVLDDPATKRLVEERAKDILATAKKRVTSGGKPLVRRKR